MTNKNYIKIAKEVITLEIKALESLKKNLNNLDIKQSFSLFPEYQLASHEFDEGKLHHLHNILIELRLNHLQNQSFETVCLCRY